MSHPVAPALPPRKRAAVAAVEAVRPASLRAYDQIPMRASDLLA